MRGIKREGLKQRKRERSECAGKMQKKEQWCFELTLPVNSYVNEPQSIYVDITSNILVSNSGHVNSSSMVNGCKFFSSELLLLACTDQISLVSVYKLKQQQSFSKNKQAAAM